MRRDLLSLDDLDALNHFERDVTASAREVRDVGFDDAEEARLKLHGIVALCSEHLGRIERRERARQNAIAREECETSVPPVEVGTC